MSVLVIDRIHMYTIFANINFVTVRRTNITWFFCAIEVRMREPRIVMTTSTFILTQSLITQFSPFAPWMLRVGVLLYRYYYLLWKQACVNLGCYLADNIHYCPQGIYTNVLTDHHGVAKCYEGECSSSQSCKHFRSVKLFKPHDSLGGITSLYVWILFLLLLFILEVRYHLQSSGRQFIFSK